MAYIDIRDVTHCYPGGGRALDAVSYSIEEGAFFSLLGPSGCGKSTLLNIIGGFIDPTSGSVEVGGEDILALPPHKRRIGMVFQSYALFPHLSVFGNVAFGLKAQRRPKGEIAPRVAEVLSLVHLEGFETRMPHQLSGGQQQRVAIARALANSPSILMLDEPLGNLDAKLRKEMQVELRRIQRDAHVTAIMVTHDQEEAMTMSDAVGIMREGVVQQVGSPRDVYERPANSFVAGFLGKVNMTRVERGAAGGLRAVDWTLAGGVPVAFDPRRVQGRGPIAAVRPERMRVAGSPGEGMLPVEVVSVAYAGGSAHVEARFAGGGDLTLEVALARLDRMPQVGDALHVGWDDADVVLVDEAGGSDALE